MIESKLKARFSEFSIPDTMQDESSVIVPGVRGVPFLRYGLHAYNFYNFATLKGFSITIPHHRILLPGYARFIKANNSVPKPFAWLRGMFQRYHYGFNFLEQTALMTVPHTITQLGNGRFLLNLWSYFGYLDIDCKQRSVKYMLREEEDDDHVFGSQHFYKSDTSELYYTTFSLRDSMQRVSDVSHPVSCTVAKRGLDSDKSEELWSGKLTDYLHDIMINKTNRYCVVCELGLHTDENKDIIPSKVLILDLQSGAQWELSRFIVAAHAQFDPDDPDVIYFSNHNFRFLPGSAYKILVQASYNMEFCGPASIFKYRLTPEGPKELGVFTQEDFFRLTNMFIFKHRGRKVMAATGSPNFVFLMDADDMTFIKKIEFQNPVGLKSFYRSIPCVVGTIAPSVDGERIFVQTNRSLQVVDIATGEAELIRDHLYYHSCSNHMMASRDTSW